VGARGGGGWAGAGGAGASKRPAAEPDAPGRVLALASGRGGALGACFYCHEDNKASLLARLSAAPEELAAMLAQVVARAQPDDVVLASNAPDALVAAAAAAVGPDVPVRRLAGRAFSAASCERRLEQLGVPLSALRSMLDVDNEVGISALGGALHAAQQADPLLVRLTSIEMVDLKDFMVISAESLLALDVVRPEHHPRYVGVACVVLSCAVLLVCRAEQSSFVLMA
jgi:DNA mismatch repair ATPase MutS